MFALDFTWYDKNTHDALIKRQLPPSNGVQQLFFQNIGSVQNKGVELSLTGTPLKGKTVAWDFTIDGSHNKNKVLKLGVSADHLRRSTSSERLSARWLLGASVHVQGHQR